MDLLHEVWDTAVYFVAIGGVGLPLLYLSTRVARWRNRRTAKQIGGKVIHVRTDPGIRLTGPVKSHRQ